jgi:hypothetical protein
MNDDIYHTKELGSLNYNYNTRFFDYETQEINFFVGKSIFKPIDKEINFNLTKRTQSKNFPVLKKVKTNARTREFSVLPRISKEHGSISKYLSQSPNPFKKGFVAQHPYLKKPLKKIPELKSIEIGCLITKSINKLF